ncbi:jhy protein homolog isoform X1 [Seriola aureovittata]|uniref:jhy protein homolog isoform X1 n=1 Tax=Seriola aureovittata TaxID=2871759 RepID=UPI0024BD6F71|nr:jhy protein homolog isoform X1 [Seriola aureovittata]XP_056252558.1 jhy protein homolog isoform X1 [Seriola aureovittata]XP_056252559.1 jhy protein homolog isoform X1 [Seriola aureovittata]
MRVHRFLLRNITKSLRRSLVSRVVTDGDWKIKGGYRYSVDTSQAVMVTPQMAGSESDQPYYLHPQDGQTNSVTSTQCHNRDLQCRSPETDTTEFQTHYQEEPRCAQGRPIQKTNTPKLTSHDVLSNKKLERPMEDIVERNKTTLGRSTSKRGSYVRVYSLKQQMPINVHETLKETATAENQEDSSAPELMCPQKTQQLWITQINKEKKAQRKEYPNLSRQQPSPAVVVKAELGDCLSSLLARPADVTQQKPKKMASSQPLPPTIHLNINLNTSSNLLSLLQQKGQDAFINLASLHGRPHWSPPSDVQLALYPGCQLTNPGRSSHMSQEGLNAQLHHRNLESGPNQWQRTTALQWPSCEGDDQTLSLNEVHTKQFPQNLTRTPTTASSQGLGSCRVLPPIGKPMTGKEPKMNPSQSVNTVNPIHGSSSDSYLVQMEKLKQLRARVTNKKLKTDMDLRGPHPDYTAIEKRKLYSNVVREQNKKISRIPFLPAKDLEGSDKKVPRMKALEYAKTIAKPPVQSQPKQRQTHQAEGFSEHAPCLQGLDVAQLTRLELLTKRHEEEKQAVSLFRKIPAV